MTYVDQLLSENEQVVLVARQSWVVLVREFLINLFLALVAVGITLVAMAVFPQYGWLAGFLMLIPAARFALQFVDWVNRSFIITNRRVVQVEGTINKNVIDSSLEKVNDVRMSQSVLGRMLNYGDVEILTASEGGTNRFRRISDPIKFKTAMLNEKEKLGFSEGAGGVAPAPTATDVPALIAQLKALFAEGLITEEEYNKKRAELLERM
jgi:uncharacterized membrane protein YdbT with pleckstrin-like domain